MIVTTTKGDMDESLLIRKDGNMENVNEKTSWVEYYLGDELVHRSVNVELKNPLVTETILGEL
jgi:hypothetical protein|tara:strand:+ start:190 stop:378 length:189 start_codon:yes stop_codon:yes gene_type:complete